MGRTKDFEEFETPSDNLLDGQARFDPVSEILQANLQDRRIIINESIDSSMLEKVELWILQFNKEDKYVPVDERKKIYLYINSPGGEMVEGAQILSVIGCSITPVITVGFGICASMAFYLLAAGHERYCFPNTVSLYHDGAVSYSGGANRARDTQKFYDKIDQNMRDYIIAHSNMDEEFLKTIADREYYMFPTEMKERGIIDKIIGTDVSLDEIL